VFLGSGSRFVPHYPGLSINPTDAAVDVSGIGIALADFNTDGKLDFVTGKSFGGFRVLAGDGRGDWFAYYDFGPLAFTYAPVPQFVIEDFDRDERPDLMFLENGDPLLVEINTSPRGCVDTLKLTYANGTLNVGFTIKSAIPTSWSTWVAFQSSLIRLWSLDIPAVPTAVSFNVAIPEVPPLGNIGVLTMMSSGTYGLMCGDWEVLDTGGIGPTADALSDMVRERGVNSVAAGR
jgi:hypothetical protein